MRCPNCGAPFPENLCMHATEDVYVTWTIAPNQDPRSGKIVFRERVDREPQDGATPTFSCDACYTDIDADAPLYDFISQPGPYGSPKELPV